MLGSAIRIAIFILLVAGGILLINVLMETPGSITIAFGGYEVVFTPLAFFGLLIALFLLTWGAIKLVGLLIATIRFIAGDETALGRYFDRSRERRGLEALSMGIIALSAGDARTARYKAEKAERLLQRPELTRLLNAQAAELGGDPARAKVYYSAMTEDPATAFVGLRGLLEQAMAAGDTDRALKLALKAHDLRPKDERVLDILYTLQSQKFNWAAARQTLWAQTRAGVLSKPEAARRESQLALAQATEAEQLGETEHARKLAVEAAKLDASNPEAVAAAARHLVAAGSKRAAAKLVIESWRRAPHPRLAAAYAAIEPDEAPAARRRRFERLFEVQPTHPETRFLRAELALTTGAWAEAREALQKLEETEPSARTCAILAAVARGEGRPETEVRGWLARALGAPRGDDSQLGQAAMLPLLIDAPTPDAQPSPKSETAA